MKIDILIPTLGRAHLLVPLVENVRETCESARVTLVVDTEDHDSFEAATMSSAQNVVREDGTYPHKTNVGFRHTACPYVLPTADDVVFHAGWWESAIAAFGDPAVMVVGTNDMTPRSDAGHATMPILSREYCEYPGCSWNEPGKVFYEGYHHNFVETEICELAQYRHAWAYERESMIEHLHPAWGTRVADETDAIGNQRFFEQDAQLWASRKREWMRT